MRIEVAGKVRIEDAGRVLEESDLPGRQGRLVLARLALEGGPVHRDALADALWPDGPPTTWERTLSGVVSRLRSAIASAGFDDLTIANAFGCYELQRPEGARLDIEIAGAEVEEASRALAVEDLARGRSSASTAVSIARRPFLSGEDAAWIEQVRAELKDVLVRGLEALASSCLGTSDAVASATQALHIDPFRESAHILLMRAHAASRNTADALLAYERCRRLLADELGVDPSDETRALHAALLQADEDALFDSLASQGLLTLPQTLTTFVGRTRALEAVLDLLSKHRVVTLVGPGGVGKTRLAIEAARGSIGSHPDGIHLIDLTQVGGASSLIGHAAEAMGARIVGEPTAQALAAVLDTQRILLILDNCEHLAEPCASFVDGIVGNTQNITVLATSRSPLGLSEEAVWDVPPLDVPDPGGDFAEVVQSESIVLFRDRAANVRPDFELTAGNAASVAAICGRLDGIPLAIELAAGRAGTLSVAEIAEHFADRLPASSSERVPRHRTLQAAIDWSYDLLGRREAECFRALSVFEGWFTATDADAICDRDVQVESNALAQHSLLVRDVTSAPVRFRMLETIKQYGRDRSEGTDAWDATIDRHIDRYVAATREIDAVRDQGTQLHAVGACYVDAAAALERALDRGRPSAAIVLAEALWRFWLARGLTTQGRTVLERTVQQARAAGVGDDVAPLLLGLGTLAFNQAEFTDAEVLWLEAEGIASSNEDERLRAAILAALASVAGATQRVDDASDRAEQAIAAAQRSGNHHAAGLASLQLVMAAHLRKDQAAAVGAARFALEQFTLGQSQSGVARALLSVVSVADPPPPDWRELLERAVEMSRQVDDRNTLAISLVILGTTLAENGVLEDSLQHLQEGLRLARRTGDIRLLLNAGEQIACVASEAGLATEAVTVFAAVDAQRAARAIAPSYFDHTGRLERLVTRATEASGAEAPAAQAAGAELEIDGIVDLAMSISSRTTVDA